MTAHQLQANEDADDRLRAAMQRLAETESRLKVMAAEQSGNKATGFGMVAGYSSKPPTSGRPATVPPTPSHPAAAPPLPPNRAAGEGAGQDNERGSAVLHQKIEALSGALAAKDQQIEILQAEQQA